MPPISPSAARSWMDNGVMFGISLVVLWGFALGLLLLYRWGTKKLSSSTPPSSRCADCAFSEDWRAPEDLVMHRIFGYLRLARAMKIPNLPIVDTGRRLVFVDLLDLKFFTVADCYTKWIKENLPRLDSMRADVLASEQLGLIGDIVAAYENGARRLGIPPVVIERFRHWHGPRVEHLRAEISLVCESEWINDPSERLGFILSVVEQIMKATIIDAEKTLASLNGALTGQVYKGVVIGPCAKRDPDSGISRVLSLPPAPRPASEQ